MKIGECKTCGKEARVGTIEELRAEPTKTPGCALIERVVAKDKREPHTHRCVTSSPAAPAAPEAEAHPPEA